MMNKIKKIVINLIRNKIPILADCIDGWKMYQHTKRYHGEDQARFCRSFYGKMKPFVLGGPFAGMLYENRTYFGPVTPRWIGCYEKELAPVIEGIRKFEPESIIDIGAAEGYYSIGLARMFPEINVYSYEINPLSLWQQNSLRKINNTLNLHIRRYCSHRDLCVHGRKKCFIISDIEGFELDLFTDKVIRCLKSSTVLIELHCHKDKDIKSVATILENRFISSHSVSFIAPSPRGEKDIEIPIPEGFDKKSLVAAMNEFRFQSQKWMHCTPKTCI